MKYYNIQFLASNADNINNACVKDNGNSQITMCERLKSQNNISTELEADW